MIDEDGVVLYLVFSSCCQLMMMYIVYYDGTTKITIHTQTTPIKKGQGKFFCVEEEERNIINFLMMNAISFDFKVLPITPFAGYMSLFSLLFTKC